MVREKLLKGLRDLLVVRCVGFWSSEASSCRRSHPRRRRALPPPDWAGRRAGSWLAPGFRDVASVCLRGAYAPCSWFLSATEQRTAVYHECARGWRTVDIVHANRKRPFRALSSHSMTAPLLNAVWTISRCASRTARATSQKSWTESLAFFLSGSGGNSSLLLLAVVLGHVRAAWVDPAPFFVAKVGEEGMRLSLFNWLPVAPQTSGGGATASGAACSTRGASQLATEASSTRVSAQPLSGGAPQPAVPELVRASGSPF